MQTKKLLSLLIAFVILLSSIPSASAVTYTDSGYFRNSKLSKAEIVALTRDTYIQNPTNSYVTVPSVTSPYTLGEVRDDIQQAALARLNSYRILAGLDTVKLNDEYTKYAQAACVVNAKNNEMTHYPTQPSDMPDDFFSVGSYGASHSNIACYMGYRPQIGSLAFSVDMWMEDSDQYNIDRLGHRRWVLNPTMSATGFGCATSADGWVHTAMYAFDSGAASGDYDFISWPPSGYMVNDTEFFTTAYAWSVSVHPGKYNTSGMRNVTVTVTNDMGRRWNFSSEAADGYFNVELGGYGSTRNAIIFKPANVLKYNGVYTVTISGVPDFYGTPTTLSYQVEFFDSDDITEPEITTEAPTTEAPTTEAPTTEAPTTEAPTTEAPTTEAPTTEAPTTEAPTTEAPTTEAPTTEAPTTEAPTTEAPTTEAPTTEAPTTEAPTTEAPTTEAPTTEAPTTEAPTTEAPTTEAPTTEAPTTEAPTTEAPTTEAPTTEAPTTEAPTTEAPTTEAPTTEAPTTEAPTTEAPTTEEPTTEKPVTAMTGDVNDDNKITALDARAALRFAAKIDIPDAVQFRAADVNHDNKLNAMDARLILRVAAKIDTFKEDATESPTEIVTEPANDFPSEGTTEEASTAETTTVALTTAAITTEEPATAESTTGTTEAQTTKHLFDTQLESTSYAPQPTTVKETTTAEITTVENNTSETEATTEGSTSKPRPNEEAAVVVTLSDDVYHDLECDILIYGNDELLALPESTAKSKGYKKCNLCLH